MPELATDLTPSDDDDRLDQAESVVRDFCGWHIAPLRDGSETVEALCGRERVYLRTLHLVEVTDVLAVGSASTFDADHYQWDAAGWVQPVVGRSWPTGSSARVTIEYTHGYADPPPSVMRAVQAIAQQGISNPGALRKVQAGPFVNEYAAGGGGGAVADALGPYVIPLV